MGSLPTWLASLLAVAGLAFLGGWRIGDQRAQHRIEEQRAREAQRLLDVERIRAEARAADEARIEAERHQVRAREEITRLKQMVTRLKAELDIVTAIEPGYASMPEAPAAVQ